MRIQFKREGGVAYFPGLSKPVTLDTDQMSAEEADELECLVEAANFFDLPSTPKPRPGGAADTFQYTVTVESGPKRHTVQVSDPVDDPNLQKLLAFLKDKTRPSG